MIGDHDALVAAGCDTIPLTNSGYFFLDPSLGRAGVSVRVALVPMQGRGRLLQLGNRPTLVTIRESGKVTAVHLAFFSPIVLRTRFSAQPASDAGVWETILAIRHWRWFRVGCADHRIGIVELGRCSARSLPLTLPSLVRNTSLKMHQPAPCRDQEANCGPHGRGR